MVDLELFYEVLQGDLDPEKREAVDAPPGATLYLVAGPGTGKTFCLTVRILKLLFVDGVPPRGIVATTFTRKAANELRSRILGVGFKLRDALCTPGVLPAAVRAEVARIDVNQVRTGTIDSLCMDLLTEYRDAGGHPPVPVDEFVARTLMLRHGLFEDGRWQNDELNRVLYDLDGRTGDFGWNIAAKTGVLQALADRVAHDGIDLGAWVAAAGVNGDGRKAVADALAAYCQGLGERGMLDYAGIETETLTRMRSGRLEDFVAEVRAVLVDEYQDTNLLQEQLYMEMARRCGGALTVVGDDDQSLYRFRGATVELFSRFPDRAQAELGRRPKTVFLSTNYRSSPAIIDFADDYARLDPGYGTVRAQGKPALRNPGGPSDGVPVLGLFRADLPTLAADLADFVRQVFRGSGFRLPDGQILRAGQDGGDLGDAAVLCASPREWVGGKPRLPGLLRRELAAGEPPIDVFNPRGEVFHSVPVAARLAGVLLHGLDPHASVESKIFLPPDVRAVFTDWRRAGAEWLGGAASRRARQRIAEWAGRDDGHRRGAWPAWTSTLDLVYEVAGFFDGDLLDDPEGQVYLESFTRQLAACELLSKFRGRIFTDPAGARDAKGLNRADRSVAVVLSDFLGPIADGLTDVNEDLLEEFPRKRLSVLSVHQAKGLEFPLVIVDVGSRFNGDYPSQAFLRFPADGGAPHAMEDGLRPFSALGPPGRPARDRAFDDLYRQFFVAFSRPQQVLVLAGLSSTHPSGFVRNVATGSRRDGSNPWSATLPFAEV
jgi:DNA helicase-2/ATP-dependent DNA helicase PcrA